jgi:type I restriction and modification enzyme subunit R-like protein
MTPVRSLHPPPPSELPYPFARLSSLGCPIHGYNQPFLAMPKPEAFSRVLIDQELRESGWDLLDERRVRFELDAHSGRADYVLSGERGPLCVLEAKRPDLDPYDAKEQARGYAENLRAPFVILSNGKEHWFWNYERADQRDAFRIERIPSLIDLERLRLKNLQPPRPLLTELIGPPNILACARADSTSLSLFSRRQPKRTPNPTMQLCEAS